MSITNTTCEPCPFCGYSDLEVKVVKDHLGRHGEVTCQICGAAVYGIGVLVGDEADKEIKAMAIQAWNTRSKPRK